MANESVSFHSATPIIHILDILLHNEPIVPAPKFVFLCRIVFQPGLIQLVSLTC